MTLAWTLAQYQRLGQAGDTVSAPDHMLIPGVDLAARRHFNHASAALFWVLCERTELVPMAVVHGASLDERLSTAQALRDLAGRTVQREHVIDVVTTIREAFPSVRLHVLGVSAPSFAAVWAAYGRFSGGAARRERHGAAVCVPSLRAAGR